MFCHGSIYFCGFVTIGGEVCSAKDAPKLALGVARMAIRAAILRPFVVGSEQLLIYILLDAAAIRQLIPERAWSVALPVYYLAAAAFVLLAIRGFFRRNQEQYRRFSAVQAACRSGNPRTDMMVIGRAASADPKRSIYIHIENRLTYR